MICKTLLVPVVLVSALATAQAAQVVSDFEDAGLGLDGWTVLGDPASGTPIHVAAGGNPGGYAEVTDSGQGQVMYWNAPIKFTGDLTAYFNGALSYDMRQSPFASLFAPGSPGDVTLIGASTTLVYSLPLLEAEYPQTSFSTRTLSLNDLTPWRVGTTAGPFATNAQIQSALGNVTALRIRAEYSLLIDTNGLDNVMLRDVSAIPEPGSAALMLSGAALLLGWRARQRAGLARRAESA